MDADGPFRHPGERRQRDVLALVHEVLVDVVGERDDVVLDAQRRDELQFLAGEDLAGRVMWGVQHEAACPRSERSTQFVEVDRPVRLMERYVARTALDRIASGP